MDIETLMKYSVGALLYSPALNRNIKEAVVTGAFGRPYSLALCLEDTISDDKVADAEQQAIETVRQIASAHRQNGSFYLPKLFIRVREPDQISRLYRALEEAREVLTGFIFPKYSSKNAALYNREMQTLNGQSSRKVYCMPILESMELISCRTRPEKLGMVKDLLEEVAPLVLNIRVGGNDFSNAFSVRRHIDETIYDIAPICQLFGDILSVFSCDYVLSGPVWEYFDSRENEWEIGLRKELRLDLLNGFVGKTVIHPKQIPIVNEMLKVSQADYRDARSIAGWNQGGLQVGKSCGGDRMNEVRTHGRWASKTLALAEVYGVRAEGNGISVI